MVERQALAAHAHELSFCRRYVDDLGSIINADDAGVWRFIDDYRQALAAENLDITFEISRVSMVLLDQQMEKGSRWEQTGRLDLTVFQKPLSAYLYIPAFSDHAAHILRSWIHGELIRYVKRSSCFNAFATVRRAFIHRLTARGYVAGYLQPIFDGVSFTDRARYLAPRVALRQPTTGPATVALTLPNTQRTNAMMLRRVLFSCAQRWLTGSQSVPEEVRIANYTIAHTTVGKLAALLIDYRFPR